MKNDGMDEMNIREYLENHKLLTDGAMGTYFDTVEKENYICSEEANITNPSLVRQIHKNYLFLFTILVSYSPVAISI